VREGIRNGFAVTALRERSAQSWALLGWMLAALLVIPAPAARAAARVGPLRIRVRHGMTIALLAVHGAARYRWRTTERPARLVLDLEGIASSAALRAGPGGIVRRVRSARHGAGDLRLVFDLLRPAPVHVSVRTRGVPGPELEIRFGRRVAERARPIARPMRPRPPERLRRVTALRTPGRRGPVIVCIDPGHGGTDPGTTGPDGLHEKTVTLEVGRLVARRIDATPGMRAVLTRDGDYYVSLRERVLDAQRHHADLFVSIHVNAFPRSPEVEGGAVYMLSEHGASDAEARMLARTENAADPTIDGVHFAPHDPRLNYVLTDLLQNQAIAAGDRLAGDILHQLGRVEPLYEPHVQRANFEVLRDPMIPSVLVETAFLSNPHQSRELHERRFIDRLANAIYRGIRGYVDTQFRYREGQEYVVRRGDTLSTIAARSGVSLHRLQAYNHLSGNDIAAGQVLHIPPGSS